MSQSPLSPWLTFAVLAKYAGRSCVVTPCCGTRVPKVTTLKVTTDVCKMGGDFFFFLENFAVIGNGWRTCTGNQGTRNKYILWTLFIAPGVSGGH